MQKANIKSTGGNGAQRLTLEVVPPFREGLGG